MTTSEIISIAADITVINDGQVRYPVETAELVEWVQKNGPITTDADYEKFCAEVEYLGAEIGTPGNGAMVDLCVALIEAGAAEERL